MDHPHAPDTSRADTLTTRVSGLYIGRVRPLPPTGERTGIFKAPVTRARIASEGLVGDQQADRRHHGGRDKALHQYAVDSYAKIAADFPELAGIAVPGTIGENLSAPDMDDSTVRIGDYYKLGSAVVQVAQPRSPCWKIDQRFGVEALSMYIEKHRITGWYYRVVEPGDVRVGDAVQLLERPNGGVPVARFVAITAQHRPAAELLDELLACHGLAVEWRTRLEGRRQYLAAQEGR